MPHIGQRMVTSLFVSISIVDASKLINRELAYKHYR